ncbi:MAG: hypothetical protein ACI4IW_03705 [Oscillospiraceae bacterium]
MSKFWVCFIYLVVIGLLSNPAAKLIDREKIDYSKFPYRSYSFEQGGKIYEKMGIRRWKSKVPDMSHVLSYLIKKEVRFQSSAADVLRQIQETCVAETTHVVLILLSLPMLIYWKSKWALLCEAAYVLILNLPFILIQRYNRPRLISLYQRKLNTEGLKNEYA